MRIFTKMILIPRNGENVDTEVESKSVSSSSMFVTKFVTRLNILFTRERAFRMKKRESKRKR